MKLFLRNQGCEVRTSMDRRFTRKVCDRESKAKPVWPWDLLHGVCLLQCPSAEGRVWVLGNELGRREKQGSLFGWTVPSRPARRGGGWARQQPRGIHRRHWRLNLKGVLSLRHPMVFRSDKISCSVVSDSLWPHESQHARPPCPSPTPRVHPDSCPSSQWCHPAISSSVIPFSSCPQSLPASESFPMSQLFAWDGQSTGVSALASVLPVNTQDWSHLGWTGWISLQSK